MKIPEMEDAEEAERHKVAKMLVGQRLAGGIDAPQNSLRHGLTNEPLIATST